MTFDISVLFIVDTIFALCALALVIRWAKAITNTLPLPPGPKPWPILGTFLDFASTHEGRFYLQHKELYGPISTLTSNSTTYIILNDLEVATELLEKRSSNTSDRHMLTLASMIKVDRITTFRRWGAELKYHRKLIRSYVDTRAAMNNIEEVEEVEARRLLLRLLNEPDHFFQHFRTYTGATMLKLSHGYTVAADGYDALVRLAEEAIDVAIYGTTKPGNMIDSFPALSFLPDGVLGASFKKIRCQWEKLLFDFYEKPYAFAKKMRSEGKAIPSYISHFLDNGVEGDSSKEDALKYSAATMFSGSIDTSPSALKSLILAMTLHPNVLRRAQSELDSIVGNDRLPDFRDREQLPYINAVVKELIRWETVLPLGIAHACSEEETYNGYRIPKGAVLIPNAWAMARDPKYYSYPSVFSPERFLKETPDLDPYTFGFGFGRRICPGKRLADSSLFIATAMILSTFNISKAKDKSGHDIEPDCIYLPGIVSHPTQFQCSIKPRSNGAVELIRSVLDDHPFGMGDSDVLAEL